MVWNNTLPLLTGSHPCPRQPSWESSSPLNLGYLGPWLFLASALGLADLTLRQGCLAEKSNQLCLLICSNPWMLSDQLQPAIVLSPCSQSLEGHFRPLERQGDKAWLAASTGHGAAVTWHQLSAGLTAWWVQRAQEACKGNSCWAGGEDVGVRLYLNHDLMPEGW